MECLENRHLLATFIVTNNADAGPGSLRAAIGDANNLAGDDQVVFDESLDGGLIALTSGQLEITDDIEISGPSNRLTIDAQRNSRVIYGAATANITLANLIVTGGLADELDKYSEPFPAVGGGIQSLGLLALTDVTVSGNTAFERGGGIRCETATLLRTSVTGNESYETGGISCGSLTVVDSTISDNVNLEGTRHKSDFYRSYVSAVAAGTLTMQGTTVSGNAVLDQAPYFQSFRQRGTAVSAGQTTVSNSMVSNNIAGARELGGFPRQVAGVSAAAGTIENSWVVNNGDVGIIAGEQLVISNTNVEDSGFGISSAGGTLIQDSRVSGNDAGIAGRRQQNIGSPIRVHDTVIEDNSVGTGIDYYYYLPFDLVPKLIIESSTITGNSVGLAASDFSEITFIEGEILQNGVGAGIHVSGEYGPTPGTITIYDSRLHSNGIGVSSTGSQSQFNGFGTIALHSSVISHSTQHGIYIKTGAVELIESQLLHNNSDNRGAGALVERHGELALVESIVSGNTSLDHGGGIAAAVPAYSLNYRGIEINIDQSTLMHNSAAGSGGGIYLYGDVSLTLLNTTISNNTSGSEGGGLSAECFDFDTTSFCAQNSIRHSTIAGNAAGAGGGISIASSSEPLLIDHTILASNLAASSPDAFDPAGRLTASHSLIGSNDGTMFAEGMPDPNGNLVGGHIGGIIDPLLDTLAYRGGPTPTHGLLPGSPALDAGNPVIGDPPMFDQRGAPFSRVLNGVIDIGSIEGAAPLAGDFNLDGLLNCDDIDALVVAIASGLHDPFYDLTSDGLIDLGDRDAWLQFAGFLNRPSRAPFPVGDANLDGITDGGDFLIWNNNKFTAAAAWCRGDFNANGYIDGLDFVIWNANKFMVTASGQADPSTTLREVPPVRSEPIAAAFQPQRNVHSTLSARLATAMPQTEQDDDERRSRDAHDLVGPLPSLERVFRSA